MGCLALRVLGLNQERGEVELVVEVLEDLYYLFLLVRKGDVVYGWTTRQLRIERATGEERGERIPVYLGVEVEKVSYAKFSEKLRFTGRVVEAPEEVYAKGSFHTIQVGVGDRVKIVKKSGIDGFTRNILEKAASKIRRVLLISVGDEEVAVGYLSPVGVEVRAVVGYSPVGRGKESSLDERYREPIASIVQRIFESGRAEHVDEVVVAVNERLAEVVSRVLGELGVKARVVKVSEGGEAGIYELLRGGQSRELLSSVRLPLELAEVERVLQELFSGKGKAVAGLENVEKVAEWGIVKTLIVSDALLFGEESRERVLKVLGEVFSRNGKIFIVPEESEAGRKLKPFGGALAELYYSLE